MSTLRSFIRYFTVFSTLLIVLAGSSQLNSIIECCLEESVKNDMDLESENEAEDLEEEKEFKTLMTNDLRNLSIDFRDSFSAEFSFVQNLNHSDFSFDFSPPPDFF